MVTSSESAVVVPQASLSLLYPDPFAATSPIVNRGLPFDKGISVCYDVNMHTQSLPQHPLYSYPGGDYAPPD